MRPTLLLLAASPGALAYCPPTGPVFPPPKISVGFKVPDLSTALEALSTGTEVFNSTATSFSFTVTTLDADVFEFHHTAAVVNASGVQHVDKNTVYRVASNTKMLTALATLLEFPNGLDDPIGKYVPELADSAVYKDVTLRLLAEHLGGVPRDGTTFDRYTLSGPDLLKLGFPVPAESEIPKCDIGPGSPKCSREAFFSFLNTANLTNPAGERVAYSDLGFILLGFALEGKTGKPYQDVISERITGPLGLTATGFVAPPIANAIVPADASLSAWFDLEFSNFKPTAGLYTTPSDLTTFFRAILSSALLTPAQTAQWLKPASLLANPAQAVGMPWEIFRPTTATTDRRPVDLYTKSGDVPGYAAWAVLIPEFAVGIAINAAGTGAYPASTALLDLVASKLVPVLDGEARRQAGCAFAGRYVSGSGNDTLRLIVDQGPGLKIEEWTTAGGRDVFEGLGVIQGEKAANLEGRLWPIGLGGRWRMGLETVGKKAAEGSMVGGSCLQWMQVDQFRYAKMPLDEFDFQIGKEGVEGVDVLGLRASLVKQS